MAKKKEFVLYTFKDWKAIFNQDRLSDFRIMSDTSPKEKVIESAMIDYWDKLNIEIDNLPNEAKIEILESQLSEFEKASFGAKNVAMTFFDDLCKIEIKQLKNKSKGQTKTVPIQKVIEPLKWQKDSVLLAYLINELKTYGFIEDINVWKTCEQIFVDKKGKPIKSETFTSMVQNYENNKTPNTSKGIPKKHTDISDLIETLKKVSKEPLQ